MRAPCKQSLRPQFQDRMAQPVVDSSEQHNDEEGEEEEEEMEELDDVTLMQGSRRTSGTRRGRSRSWRDQDHDRGRLQGRAQGDVRWVCGALPRQGVGGHRGPQALMAIITDLGGEKGPDRCMGLRQPRQQGWQTLPGVVRLAQWSPGARLALVPEVRQH